MEMNSAQRIEAGRQKVWEALNDTDVLKASMPGCESFDATSENTFEARITAKVGPVKARFKFNVNLYDIDPPNGYTIVGEGQGGAAGFAKGSASVNLTEDGAATILSYKVKANVGGKLAQLGARLIDGAAKKMADEFFGNFIAIVVGEAQASGESKELKQDTTAQHSGLPVWVWTTAVIVIAAIIYASFA
ncbi:MAG: carbon monoxide dehydrogenase subunit G [Proteobacteria bacterium]|nr:carbon monoxide dehydrogenase subunit G [Pseudomonadota bacterium]